MLTESDITFTGLNDDDNKGAYEEILDNSAMINVMRTTTVKSLMDYQRSPWMAT